MLGNGEEDLMSPDVSSEVPAVSAVQAEALVSQGAVLLDVREPEETASGRAEGAMTVPLGELAQRLGELPGDVTFVVVCRTGNRSSIATGALDAAGFDAVNLDGGMLAWQDAGLPVVSEDGGPGIVL
jgi:rhodanese-related sulfurtransferase